MPKELIDEDNGGAVIEAPRPAKAPPKRTLIAAPSLARTEQPSGPAALANALALRPEVDVAQIEKLMRLQMEWDAEQARRAYIEAMAAFRAAAPVIEKDRHVKETSRSGGTGKSYSHASLANIIASTSGPLAGHGLSAAWSTSQNGQVVTVTCTVRHLLGHGESTALAAPADTTGSKNSVQAIGSTVTYLQRYTLLALLGLTTADADDDGEGAAPVYVPPPAKAVRAAVPAPADSASDDGPPVDHPNRTKRIVISGHARWTAGVTASTLVAVYGLKEAAKSWMLDHGIESSLDLTEVTALDMIADLQDSRPAPPARTSRRPPHEISPAELKNSTLNAELGSIHDPFFSSHRQPGEEG